MAKNNNSDFIDIVGLFRQYVKKWSCSLFQ